MKNKVLFLSEKWTDANPNLGFSNNFHNLFDTFLQTQPDYQLHTIHQDECALLGRHIDEVIPDYCERFKIDILFVSLIGQMRINPSVECLKFIQSSGVSVCMIWPDSNPLDMTTQDETDKFVDLNVYLDFPISPTHAARVRDEKHLYLWTPESSFLYYPDNQNKEVSFIGSIRYPERQTYIQKLLVKVPNVFICGGQRESRLSPEGYARLIRDSKININFSNSPMGSGYCQAKGRVFESLASKTLLLEQANPSTRNFFTPEEDYIEFFDSDDLADKIAYYSSNKSIREKIAENGHNKFKENYTAKHFWDKVMVEIAK